MDNFENSATFFTSITENVGLYTDIAKENIRYDKFLQDARYKKLVQSTQEESNSNEEKICYTNMTNIALIDPQKSENINGQKNTSMSNI